MFSQIFIFIFILIIGCVILYSINYLENKYTNLKERFTCDLRKLSIDDILVVLRNPTYSKLMNKLIDEKKFIFTDEELKILKNPHQIYNYSPTMSNISEKIYTCLSDSNNNEEIPDLTDDNLTDDVVSVGDRQYDMIRDRMLKDIKTMPVPNCENIQALKDDIPYVKSYLKNYYKDMYGNQVKADLKDYFTAYYTLMSVDEDVGFPVETMLGKSNFIIPDQYEIEKHLTNAYNIDWNRMINPLTYYQ